MGVWFLLSGMFFMSSFLNAFSNSNERAQLYMEACAKQELFASIPPLNFTCDNKIAGGYYADIDTGCHIFHLCAPSNLQVLTDHPFCCHPELVFDQRFLVCDRPENVDCPVSYRYYSDQFDGPVKVQQRENEKLEAMNNARQSRNNEEPDALPDSSDEYLDDEDQVMDLEPPHPEAEETSSQSAENHGKAVTLPPAFRNR